MTPLYLHTYIDELRALVQPPEGRPVILDSQFNHAVWFVAAQELEGRGLVWVKSARALGASWEGVGSNPRVVVKISWKS